MAGYASFPFTDFRFSLTIARLSGFKSFRLDRVPVLSNASISLISCSFHLTDLSEHLCEKKPKKKCPQREFNISKIFLRTHLLQSGVYATNDGTIILPWEAAFLPPMRVTCSYVYAHIYDVFVFSLLHPSHLVFHCYILKFFAWHEYSVSCISLFLLHLFYFSHHSVMKVFINHQGTSASVAGGVHRADSASNDTIFLPQC